MIKIKKAESITLKGKGIVITDNKFCDSETGEELDLVSIFKDTFGDQIFDITVIQKVESEE